MKSLLKLITIYEFGSLMPLDLQIISIDRVLVRDAKANVVFANAEPVKIDCGAAP